MKPCLHLVKLVCVSLILGVCQAAENQNDEGDAKENADSGDLSQDDAYYYRRGNGAEWQVDDPYYFFEDEDQTGEDFSRSSIIITMAYTLPVAGLASAIFCTAVALYFSKLNHLMNRYLDEGVHCKGIVLASDPNIRRVVESEERKARRRQLLRSRSSGLDGSFDESRGGSHDYLNDYTSMTDDAEDDEEMSYQYRVKQLPRGSDDSGGSGDSGDRFPADQTSFSNNHHTFSTSWTSNKMIGVPKSTTSQRPRDVRFNLDNLDHINSNEANNNSTILLKIPSRKFRVVVEYDDPGRSNSSDMPKRMRKELTVNGKDMEMIKTFGGVDGIEDRDSEITLELYVLQAYPMSGYPRVEVYRSLQLCRRLAIVGPLLCGFVITISGGVSLWLLSSPIITCIYVVLVFVQFSFVRGFLSESISKLIAREYLERGVSLTFEQSKEQVDERDIFSMMEEEVSKD